jgi:tRNA nucleotidyltransferase/poly(A) polymerase
MDIVVNALTIKDLYDIENSLFSNLKADIESYPSLFRRPYKIRNYGKLTFTLYGMDIDLEIMAKNRTITPIPSFIPTNNIEEDAVLRDMTVNAVFYDIKKQKIRDPLKGIDDMRQGILQLPLGQKTFQNDFLRVFSIIKTSSKLDMKISQDIDLFIKYNESKLKEMMLQYRDEIINSKLKKIIDGEFSLKAYKLLYDYNFYDPVVPEEKLNIFYSNKTVIMNEMFNKLLIGETVLHLGLFNITTFTKDDKYNYYMDVFKYEFDESHLDSVQLKGNLTEYLLLRISHDYCSKINCSGSILKYVNLEELKNVIENF